MGRFKKGMFLGGLLGAGFSLMMTTKKGRELRDQILDHAADLYTKLKEDLITSGQLEKITKQKYVTKVTKVVNSFVKEKGLPDNTKKMLVKLISAQWSNLKKK